MGEMLRWFVVAFLVISSLGILYCIVGIINPRKIWYWQEGWKYKNTTMVEPSDARLFGLRIGSVLGAVVMGLFIVGAVLVLSGAVRLFE